MHNFLLAFHRTYQVTLYLKLLFQELQEEFARVLTVHNTRVPDSLVEWSWKWREFVRLPSPPHLMTLLNVTGTIMHKDSEEAKVQLAGGIIGKPFLCLNIIKIVGKIINTMLSYI